MQFCRAYICYSCDEVFENAPCGKCKVCSSSDVYPLSWFGRTEEEKHRWFSLINGEKTPSEARDRRRASSRLAS
jgi:hypothetical protein